MNAPAWAGTRRILLLGGVIHAPGAPGATAMLVDGDTIAWLGDDAAATVYSDTADEIWHLGDRLVTPGFVDAHVHATSTGLSITGLDLGAATSLAQALDLVARAAAEQSGSVLIGHGWDETEWSDARPPTAAELDRATGDGLVYLTRVDAHCAVVSGALLRQLPDLAAADGYRADGWLTRSAHHRAREFALESISDDQRLASQRAMRARASALGIVAVHEMAGPVISGTGDLAGLLDLAAREPGPLVTGYWGQLAQEGGIETARAIGAFSVGGDLFVDGSIGSHTACLRTPYADRPDSHGAQYLDEAAIAEHVRAAVATDMPAGFHVIGDAAADAVLLAAQRVADDLGAAAIRRAGLRLEHAELLDDGHLGAMAALGVTASMQPMFDARWGGPGGMYAARLGTERAAGMNRFADLARAGIAMAFGSDAPVTELGPWAAVRAAVLHTVVEQRLSARAAFNAHTRGGWRAIGEGMAGVIAPGSPAHLVVWDADELVVQVQDDRVRNWSTDPRSATPVLPLLGPDIDLPTAVCTLVAGRVVHDTGAVG